MKKSFSKMSVLAMAAFAFVACNNQPVKNDTAAGKAETSTAAPAANSQKVAYVEIRLYHEPVYLLERCN